MYILQKKMKTCNVLRHRNEWAVQKMFFSGLSNFKELSWFFSYIFGCIVTITSSAFLDPP